MSLYREVGLAVIFLWFVCVGISHFLMTEFFSSLLPDSISMYFAIVYVSGFIQVVGAVGVLTERYRKLAGNVLCLLTGIFMPSNVYMLLNLELYSGFSPQFLLAWVVIQVALSICTIKFTRSDHQDRILRVSV
ncbi:MAG: hypothetical protein COA42_15710 [Alteromonadaceae bacterium]|nr:MAG: hypothetical protein COA42_15710 [Alteromonadaceae bacterium]